jgi:xylulokinase
VTSPPASGGDPRAISLLTIDLGTSTAKVAGWAPDGLITAGRSALSTTHPHPGRAEQDPDQWWPAVVAACSELSLAAPHALDSVAAVGLCGARETFVPVTDDLTPLGPAIAWSDRRAQAEATRLATDLGGAESLRDRTGLVLDAGSVVAKLAWLADHEPHRLERSRWIMTPRDLVASRLTGAVATDVTIASRSGLLALAGGPAPETSALGRGRLPPVLASTAVLGPCRPAPAASLGIPSGVPVVIGAGDRACEVLGTGAGPRKPMVSWGTTANVSAPVDEVPAALPTALSVSAGAFGGHLLEAGLSASGAALEWLAGITGTDVATLMVEASTTTLGARGVIGLPWLNGARAPWWSPAAGGAFLGLSAAHQRGDLARAMVEGIAFDLGRSLVQLAPGAEALVASGGGSEAAFWRSVLAAATGRSVEWRSCPDGAGAGACLVAAAATGLPFELEAFNRRAGSLAPDAEDVAEYRRLQDRLDAVAANVVSLPGACDPGGG